MFSQYDLDLEMMQQAKDRARFSTDRSRKIGCVITSPEGQILSEGWNTVPLRCQHTEERHQRPAKYIWTEHAERNAIYAAARAGTALLGSTIYVPWYPCPECARGIIASGIARLVAYRPDFNDPRWGADFKEVEELLKDAQVPVTFLPGEAPKAAL